MMKGDVYSVTSKGQLSDLTGSTIYSNRPVAVVTGQNCTYLPDRRDAACETICGDDASGERMGKGLSSGSFNGRLKGDFIRVFSGGITPRLRSMDSRWRIFPTRVVKRDVGGHDTGAYAASMEFTSNNPMYVAQYNNSSQYDQILTDPFFLVLTPVEQYQTAADASVRRRQIIAELHTPGAGLLRWNDMEIAPGGTEDWQKLAV